jgi:hypothetical protein
MLSPGTTIVNERNEPEEGGEFGGLLQRGTAVSA